MNQHAIQMEIAVLAGLMLLIAAPQAHAATEYIEAEVASDIVPSPVKYSVLLPEGYKEAKTPFPLLLDLHGGGGNRDNLKTGRIIYEEQWKLGVVAPMVVVTPSVTERCFYMDTHDGKEKWETFISGPFLKHLREKYNVRKDREGTLLTGPSMGGQGSLRLGFKHPDVFGALAAQEPGIEPVLHWKEIKPKHRFWRGDALMQAAYGNPIDEPYYEANNPASIVVANPAKIRSSGIAIYLEAGDMDMFWLYEGTEFLHQKLWENKIPHEYHLVRWSDHVGPGVGQRKREALRFLTRYLNPQPQDQQVINARQRIDPLKQGLTEGDHYGIDPALQKK